MINKKFRWIFTVFLLIAMLSSSAWAGGIGLYEIGTPDVGLASAGYAARAQDAATVATNPAGMTRLKNSEFMGGLQALYGDIGFSPNANTTVSGGDGGTSVGFLPGASAFYVHNTSEDLRLGIGLFSNFGLAYEYDSDWVGRYYTNEGALVGLSVMPTIAYRINEQFSVGGGINCMYGVFSNEVAINNIAPSAEDGKLKVEDEDFGFGANVGLLYELSEATRLGVTYSSEVDLEFDDIPEFSNVGPLLSAALNAAGLIDNKLNLDFTVPQMVMTSFYHAVDEKTAILGNVGWQDWSEFGKIGVQVDSEDPTSLTKNRNYKDTWHGALGIQHHCSDSWMLSCGIAYDSSMMDDEDRTPDLPVGESWRYGVGAIYKYCENIDLGVGYTLMWLGDLPMDQERGKLSGRVAGKYKHSAIHFLAFNVRWAF
jgi:long-chain fatty acid transport protein